MSGLGGRACGPPLHPDPPSASEGLDSAPPASTTDRSRFRGLLGRRDSMSSLLEAGLDSLVAEVAGVQSLRSPGGRARTPGPGPGPRRALCEVWGAHCAP